MEHLRRAANISIGRACGFAGLGILCVMIGLSYEPLLAARSGAVLTTLTTIALLAKARYARYQDYRKTELWLLLDKRHAPPARYARWASATVLRDTYLWFAQYAAGISILLWVAALLLSLFGPDERTVQRRAEFYDRPVIQPAANRIMLDHSRSLGRIP